MEYFPIVDFPIYFCLRANLGDFNAICHLKNRYRSSDFNERNAIFGPVLDF